MNDTRATALAFLKAHQTGALATIAPEGTPRVRLIYYAADDAFRIYFFTLGTTRKAKDLAARPEAAFAVSDTSVPQTLQMEGRIEDVTEAAGLDPAIAELTEALFSNAPYYAPVNRLGDGVLTVFRLTPNWIRWGDFTKGTSPDAVFTELS